MRPDPMYIVRTDNSVAKAPHYEEFDDLEKAQEYIENMLNDQEMDGSGDIGFSVQLYSVDLGCDQESECCGDCIDCEQKENNEE